MLLGRVIGAIARSGVQKAQTAVSKVFARNIGSDAHQQALAVFNKTRRETIEANTPINTYHAAGDRALLEMKIAAGRSDINYAQFEPYADRVAKFAADNDAAKAAGRVAASLSRIPSGEGLVHTRLPNAPHFALEKRVQDAAAMKQVVNATPYSFEDTHFAELDLQEAIADLNKAKTGFTGHGLQPKRGIHYTAAGRLADDPGIDPSLANALANARVYARFSESCRKNYDFSIYEENWANEWKVPFGNNQTAIELAHDAYSWHYGKFGDHEEGVALAVKIYKQARALEAANARAAARTEVPHSNS